ncbi:biotin/lipoyl-binding protein [Vibrio lentus]|nr:biotin/lipoyl-binding protein [Vibrio lentus]
MPVGSEVAGKVVRLNVVKGDAVKAGQALLRLIKAT